MTAPQSTAEKEKAAQLVAQLPRTEQVDLLAQALLREYMHRRGFTNTLRTFDAQNPRDERTISSRAVMRQLLNIPVEGRPSRLKPQPAAPGSKKMVPPTYMEELCSYRLTKRDYTRTARQKLVLERKAADGGEAALTDEERRQLVRWHEDRSTYEDPSDTEMTAWREETEQHRIQREAAESLLAEGPQLLQEVARAEKKREQKEERKRQRKEARRAEKKKNKKKQEAHTDDHDEAGANKPRGSRDGSDDEDEDGDDAAGPHIARRWAPPGLAAPGPGGSHRSSLERPDLDKPAVSAHDRESWTMDAMALNPILAAALSEVEASDEVVARRHSGGAAASTTTSGSAVSSSSSGLRTGPPSASAMTTAHIAGTGTAFAAAPVRIASRDEITEAWRPGGGAAARGGGGDVAGFPSALARGAKLESDGTGGGFTYNPGAVPAMSALAKPSVRPSASSLTSSSSPAAAPAPATTGGILAHRNGGGSGGGLSAAVRGDGEHLAHSAGTGGAVRQGFGFRRDSGGEAGTGGSRKDRRVKLLVD